MALKRLIEWLSQKFRSKQSREYHAPADMLDRALSQMTYERACDPTYWQYIGWLESQIESNGGQDNEHN